MNGDLRNLALNLVAGLLMFIFGFVTRQGVAWLRSLRIGGFWRPMATGDFTVVIGRFSRIDFLDYDPSGLIGVGDVRAEEELRELFRRARLPPFKVAYADSITPEECDGNLILLGGVDSNRITAEMIGDLGTRITWVSVPGTPPDLYDNISDPPWKHTPVKGDNENVIDFGTVIRARNPRKPRSWVVIIAGCWGYATWAGARLTDHQDLVRAPEEFEFIYRTEVVNGAPRKTTPVTGARRLPSSR